MGFTKEQQAAIDAQGRVIVSASAGSGKTTVMIEKIIRLIQSGVNVDEILAVTFTKKAASQMKEKLGKALIKSINAEETTAEKRAALKKQLNEVPSADISTIHSFCAKLIRSHFFAAGVDNAFRVIGGDDAEGTAIKSEALDELLEEGYAAKENDEDFAHLLSVYWRKKSDKSLRKIFLTTYEDLRSRADYREYLQRSAEYTAETFDKICKELYERFVKKCRYYVDFLEDERIYFEGIEAAPQTALCKELIEWLETVVSAKDYFEAAQVKKPEKFTTNSSSKKNSEEKKLHIARLGALRVKAIKVVEDEFAKLESREEELNKFLCSARTAAALSRYLLLFDQKFAERKLQRGVLDYNDLEHKALELLAIPEIAEEIKAKYRYVFVDEYQDVNLVQEEIVNRLSGDNLFLVGDVKQAIYGFRGSKSRFFVEKQRSFAEGQGLSLVMRNNFRSSDKVLEAVNGQFSLAMTPQTCSVDYARDAYMERGGRYPADSGRVEIHFLETEEEKEKKKEKKKDTREVYSVRSHANKQDEEISRAAKVIKRIIEQELCRTYYDPDTGEYRKVEYSDIAILSRKKQGQIVATVAALSAEGIPVASATAVNICEYAEVKTLIDILSLLDNAEQDVPLCSALLSSMGDLTADDLATIRLEYKSSKRYPYFRMACQQYAKEKKDKIASKLQAFYQYFEKVRALSQVLDAGELLSQIIAETRMEARLLARENGLACVKRIHRFIEESYNPEPLSVHGFLAHLRDLDYEIEYGESGGENSVKVLTMHSSKGLEYPIVILDNLSGKFRGVDHDEVIAEEKFGLAPRAFDEGKMLKRPTLLRRLFAVQEAEDSIADELNLYYVALTRAKYGLHMLFNQPSVIPDVKYAKSYEEMTDFSLWKSFIVEDFLFDEQKQERQALVFDPDKELTGKIMQAFTWEYPFAGYENLRVKSSATQLMSEHGEEYETPDANGVAAVGFGADESVKTEMFDTAGETEDVVAAGIAYHAFLEHFDFSWLYREDGTRVDGEELSEVVDRALAHCQEIGTDGWEILVKEKLVEILSNPVFGELRGMRLYPEQEFLVRLPVKDTYGKYAEEGSALCRDDGEEMIFQGAIDLLAIGETVRIIDYKYSTRNAEELRAHYMPQLELYRATVAKILKVEPRSIHCSIVNIRQGFQVDMD